MITSSGTRHQKHAGACRLIRTQLLVAILILATTACARPLDRHESTTGSATCLQGSDFDDAMTAYFEIGNALAQDGLSSVPEQAQRAIASYSRLGSNPSCEQQEAGLFPALLESVKTIRGAKDLVDARRRYSEWSRLLIESLKSRPAAQKKYLVFRCTMTEGYNQWLQDSQPLRNPHQGQAMLSCGSPAPWSDSAPELSASSPATAATDEDVTAYVCPMHPGVRTKHPDQCPLCGMDLVPLRDRAQPSGAMDIDDATRHAAGIHTTRIMRRPMQKIIRTFAEVQVDRTRQRDVALRFSGFIEDAWVVDVGARVRKGDALFSIYSPALYAAQKEYLDASRSSSTATLASVIQSARNRLLLAGMTSAQIDEVKKRNKPFEHITWFAPITGYVLEQNIVQGAHVELGQTLYRIAPLDRVWVEAEVHEQDQPFVQVGTRAQIRAAFRAPAEMTTALESAVTYLSPTLHPERRTRIARVVIPSPGLMWLPGASVEMTFNLELGDRLQVPKSAVVHTGPRKIVFVDAGNGKLQPRAIRTGAANADAYEVLEGLREDEHVVSAGTFLVSSESRMRDLVPVAGVMEKPAKASPADEKPGVAPPSPGAMP